MRENESTITKESSCVAGVNGSCDRPQFARGYCRTHYEAFRHGASTEYEIGFKNPPKECSEAGCSNQSRVNGKCRSHFYSEKNQTDKLPPTSGESACAVEDCEVRRYAKGMCRSHYLKQRYWRNKEKA